MLYAQNATTSNTLHGITVKESGPTTADEILVLTAGVVTFNTTHNLPSDVVGRWSAVAAAFKGGGP